MVTLCNTIVFGMVVFTLLLGGMMAPGMMGRYGLPGNRRWGSETERYDSPEEIARRRYAAGEITREEFRRIMEDLER
ncbi:MAG: SHOCT domain-containing protein [Spirochaetaceae bacterium]